MIHLLLAVIYLSFISLGLPDSLLGSAWPVIYGELDVPVSFAGIISMIIACGTIVSSLFSDRLTRSLGTGRVTAISVAMTALALFGFSISPSFVFLCLWAVPYGLGAGSVDASLNNFVALHFSSRHMSWLHCMWGVGASAGPFIMGHALTSGQGWTSGYRAISLIQICLTAVLVVSLPLWKAKAGTAAVPDGAPSASDGQPEDDAPLSLKQVLALPKAKAAAAAFFFYCALEQTAGLWSGTYLTLSRGVPAETAASWASLFYLGITIGRGAGGFLSGAFSDRQMVRLGQTVTACGILILLLPIGNTAALAGLILIGLGCAPIYPSMIHSTPVHFGAARSQAVIGIEMATAYVGTCLMPPLFGWLAGHVSPGLFPFYLILLLLLMAASHEALWRRKPGVRKCCVGESM